MKGDDVRTGLDSLLRRLHRIGEAAAARVAQRGHVVDVHAQQRKAVGRRSQWIHSLCKSMRSWRVRSVCPER
jgi:hypothetical protein